MTAQVFELRAGARTLRDTVRPWTTSYQRGARVGSGWVVADANGRCLAVYVADAAWTRASIRAR